MENLKLGIKEQYDIDEEIIKKYNLRAGSISPFTRLKIIDISEMDDGVDIKKPSLDDDGIDIKKPSLKVDDDGIDIKKPSKKTDDGIDIKKPSIKADDGIDTKKV